MLKGNSKREYITRWILVKNKNNKIILDSSKYQNGYVIYVGDKYEAVRRIENNNESNNSVKIFISYVYDNNIDSKILETLRIHNISEIEIDNKWYVGYYICSPFNGVDSPYSYQDSYRNNIMMELLKESIQPLCRIFK